MLRTRNKTETKMQDIHNKTDYQTNIKEKLFKRKIKLQKYSSKSQEDKDFLCSFLLNIVIDF